MNFDAIRKKFGPLNQHEVDCLNFLADASAGLPVKHRAYILATAWHETARFDYMEEQGGRSYFNKYEPGTHLGDMLGNVKAGDGYLFRGRGFCQLTGRHNYQRAGLAVGADLVGDPEKAAEPAIAAKIIVEGMKAGWFTGQKLSQFTDYIKMRGIINGRDRAILIAGYAEAFQKAMGGAPAAKPPEGPKVPDSGPSPTGA